MKYQNTFKRYEIKYVLTDTQKQGVLVAMAPYMKLDKYGRATIRNIYFDTDDFRLIRHSVEKPVYKEKLRVRSYSLATPDANVFVELKKKYKSVVYKRRIVLPEAEVMTAFDNNAPLPINGTGTLTVTSPSGHGIVCKDDLVMAGGTYTVNSAFHALQANDSIRIKDIALTATAGKDGLHAENSDDNTLGFIYISSGTLNITAEGDGVSAGGYLQIEEGNVTLLAGGGYENGDKHSSEGWGNMPGGGFPMGGGSRPPRSASAETTSEAADASTSMKGLKAENGILISGGTFKIDSADDAVHSNSSLTISGGTFEIASGDDALHAEETLTVNAGNIDISTSYEGIEALRIYIKGGDIKLVATDDGLNAAGGTDSSGTGGRDNMFGGSFGGGFGGGNFGGMGGNSDGSIVVSGGTLYINSSGDGMDANGTLEITGGHTTVVGPTSGDTATLDYDKTGTITGGTFIGTGSSMMAQSFSSAKQGVIAVQIGEQSAETLITLTDKNGNTLVSYAPELPFQVIILSTPEMKSGEKYTLTVGTQSAEFEA